ncbi:MAG: hypothetical protein JW820_09100 [Spirochaetales bacterium]|nr:hypothetical protein [Spirochaetales bacterium]
MFKGGPADNREGLVQARVDIESPDIEAVPRAQVRHRVVKMHFRLLVVEIPDLAEQPAIEIAVEGKPAQPAVNLAEKGELMHWTQGEACFPGEMRISLIAHRQVEPVLQPGRDGKVALQVVGQLEAERIGQGIGAHPEGGIRVTGCGYREQRDDGDYRSLHQYTLTTAYSQR